MKKTILKYLAVILLTVLACYKLMPRQVETRTEVQVKVQEKVKTITKIVERPDGTKETEIKEDRSSNTDSNSISSVKPISRDWSIAAGMALGGPLAKDIYSLQIQRRILLGASVGVYARTDKEIGLLLGYSF
jgi:hypothetical protein